MTNTNAIIYTPAGEIIRDPLILEGLPGDGKRRLAAALDALKGAKFIVINLGERADEEMTRAVTEWLFGPDREGQVESGPPESVND